MNEGVVKAFTTRQHSRATSRSSPIGPSTGCSFIIKTRIKTSGLWCRRCPVWWSQIPYPIKTRIKTWNNCGQCHFNLFSLRYHIPSKQGLRLLDVEESVRVCASQIPYPIKTRMKKCPVDISKVRHSESAEQNTFGF